MAARQLPPGFRFHPTDEELVVQYLRRKALSRPLPAAVIPDIHDAGMLDPWDLPGAGDGEAYFFSFRQELVSGRKGGGGRCRRRRRAGSGYWKPTGTEKPVFLRGFGYGGGKQQVVGVKTTLSFHRAKPPSWTGWVMHEYRLAAAIAGAAAEQKKSGNHMPCIQCFLAELHGSDRRMGSVPDLSEEWIVEKASRRPGGCRRPDAGQWCPRRRSGSAAAAVVVVFKLCHGGFRRRRSQQWLHRWCTSCLSKRGLVILKN